jgi:hypothetical protein
MKYPSKEGYLVIDDTSVRLETTFTKRVIWSVQRSAIVGVETEQHGLSQTIVFTTTGLKYKTDMGTRQTVNGIVKQFS